MEAAVRKSRGLAALDATSTRLSCTREALLLILLLLLLLLLPEHLASGRKWSVDSGNVSHFAVSSRPSPQHLCAKQQDTVPNTHRRAFASAVQRQASATRRETSATGKRKFFAFPNTADLEDDAELSLSYPQLFGASSPFHPAGRQHPYPAEQVEVSRVLESDLYEESEWFSADSARPVSASEDLDRVRPRIRRRSLRTNDLSPPVPRPFLIGEAEDQDYRWLWPRKGDSQSPLLREHRIGLRGVPSCESALLPDAAFAEDPPPVLDSRKWTAREIWRGNGSTPTRALVWLARYGLGNTLRGYCSSFVYALLSGRRLLRAHTGGHRQVLNTMCEAFKCGGGELVGVDRMKATRANLLKTALPGPELALTLVDPYPLLYSEASDFFSLFWMEDQRIRQCVYDATGCSSDWCVRGRAIHHLLGKGPTDSLVAELRRVVRRKTGKGIKGSRGEEEGVFRAMEEAGGRGWSLAGVIERMVAGENPGDELEGSIVAAEEEATELFDVAVHVRTMSMAVERFNCFVHGVCNKRHGTQEKLRMAEHKKMQIFVDPDQWDCIGKALRLFAASKASGGQASSTSTSGGAAWADKDGGRSSSIGDDLQPTRLSRLRIFLATDHEALRPKFLQFLGTFGDVYYSTGHVTHTDTPAGGIPEGRLPTMAEFYLLSQARVVIGYWYRLSTFAYFAAMYGNNTVMACEDVHYVNNQCHFNVTHYAAYGQT